MEPGKPRLSEADEERLIQLSQAISRNLGTEEGREVFARALKRPDRLADLLDESAKIDSETLHGRMTL